MGKPKLSKARSPHSVPIAGPFHQHQSLSCIGNWRPLGSCHFCCCIHGMPDTSAKRKGPHSHKPICSRDPCSPNEWLYWELGIYRIWVPPCLLAALESGYKLWGSWGNKTHSRSVSPNQNDCTKFGRQKFPQTPLRLLSGPFLPCTEMLLLNPGDLQLFSTKAKVTWYGRTIIYYDCILAFWTLENLVYPTVST